MGKLLEKKTKEDVKITNIKLVSESGVCNGFI